VARFRLARRAQADLAGILAVSEKRWGSGGRSRYATLLAAAMRQIASQPLGPLTRNRSQISVGVRSLHLRLVRQPEAVMRVGRPVHVVFYRIVQPEIVEILRVLHERMQPSDYLNERD